MLATDARFSWRLVWIVVGVLAGGRTLPADPAVDRRSLEPRAAVQAHPSDSAGESGTKPGSTLPQEVDLRPAFDRFGLAPRSQGSRSTCSLFAVAGVANYEWLRGESKAGTRFSEEFLIWAADEATGMAGDQAMFYEAIHGLNAFGICREELMPYGAASDASRKPSEEAIRDAADRAGRWQVHWIRRWDTSRPVEEGEIASVKRALADGHPVACGLRWPKSNRAEELVAPPAADAVYDGHSIILVGYADDPDRPGGGIFRFRNSRGPRWGDRGCGVMSYAYVRAYANDAVWLEMGPPGCERPRERFEAEGMTVVASHDCEPGPQSMRPWKAKMWSGGRQLHCRAADGGWVELEFTVREAGRYRLRVLATVAPDYGRVRVSVDGEAEPAVFDLYCGRVSPAGSLELGTRDWQAGRHVIRVSAAGRNPAASGYGFGLDCVDLLSPLR